MNAFRNVLQEYLLKDLDFIQGDYTWPNYRQNHSFTKERHDRAIANFEWCEAFGGGNVQVLAFFTSDHCPILMIVGQQNNWTRKSVLLKQYEYSWSLFTNCEEVITNAWQMHGSTNGASIKQKRKSLQALQQYIIVELVQQLRGLQQEIDDHLEREHVTWQQRTKENWLHKGDRNTTFYHLCATQKGKRNNISKIIDDTGRTLSYPM
ncbi:hypothetical protein I3843_04G089800 [Carya illinoinensis]|nr:hypothetical protein I3843_04G089800 [Carya illinoinensis]